MLEFILVLLALVIGKFFYDWQKQNLEDALKNAGVW
jgi:hypothetical protein